MTSRIVPVAAATTLAAVVASGIWRIEWFDVFRWGVPDPSVMAVYAVYVGAAAAAGWFVAALVTRRGFLHRPASRVRQR